MPKYEYDDEEEETEDDDSDEDDGEEYWCLLNIFKPISFIFSYESIGYWRPTRKFR